MQDGLFSRRARVLTHAQCPQRGASLCRLESPSVASSLRLHGGENYPPRGVYATRLESEMGNAGQRPKCATSPFRGSNRFHTAPILLPQTRPVGDSQMGIHTAGAR